MKYPLFILFVLFSMIILCQSKTEIYKYNRGYFEYTLNLNWNDSTFSYFKVGDMIYERSFGYFKKDKDTLLLNSSDTAFYDYSFFYEPNLKDTIKLISHAIESFAPFICKVNDSIIFLTEDIVSKNDSVTNYGLINRKEFTEPIILEIDANQRNPIVIPHDKNVIFFESWFGGWRFHEFNNDKWIIIEDGKIRNSITEFWKNKFNIIPRRNYFKKNN